MTDLWETPLDDSAPAGPAAFNRPADIGAEHIVLGAVMRQPDRLDELDFHPDDFSDDRHRWIWHAVDELRHDITDGEVGFVAVANQLRAWHADGTMPTRPLDTGDLFSIYQAGTAGSAAQHYANIITGHAAAARTIDLGITAQAAGYGADYDPDAVTTALQQQLDGIVRGHAANAPKPLGELVDPALDRAVTPAVVEDRVPTGLMDLDALTGGGFAPGRLVIVGARPGTGKTTLGTGFARAAAIANKVPTLFVTLEMSEDEITNGIVSAEARVPLHRIATGQVDEAGAAAMARARDRMVSAPLYISDDAHVSLPSLRGQVRHLKRTVGLRMVVVDYLQLMQAPKAESRQVAVSTLSRQLKLLAKEFDLAVVVLAQLNRMSEQRADKRPGAADLRESGAIEQDADIVILLYRPDMHDPESARAGEVELIVDKHRGGPRSTITAAWQGHYARMVDMAAT